MSSKKIVDYIIVGGGAAGSALAHRLGENPQNRVLVIEAAGPDERRHPMLSGAAQAPIAPKARNRQASRTLGMSHRSTDGLAGGRAEASGTIRSRGGEADYATWEAAGATGWNWARFQGAFTAMERQAAGVTGPHVDDSRPSAEAVSPPDATSELWIRTLARQGIDTVEELGGERTRVAYPPQSVPTDLRTGTVRPFPHGYPRRRNVRVRLHCTARRILFDGTTAIGVEAVTPRGAVRFTARREVILCAGAVGNPLLLERSGVGDSEVLTTAGVHLVAANPAVGGNLRQRRGAAFTLRPHGVPEHGPDPVTPAAGLGAWLRRALRRPDVPTRETTSILAVLNSDREASGPDMELLFTPIPAGGATVAFFPRSPTSVGTVHISGPALKDPPRLVPGHLSTDQDRELTVAAFARTREILAGEPFASAMTETFPGADVADPADVLRYVREDGVTEQAVGTCALGLGGVVDDELRVRGTHRLRVADASVMPTLTTGDTEAASMAVGWIAGDVLRNANTRSRWSGWT
ncbi:GMC family oxidoreductase N-terminal domain-containing protein [Streptomyces levis]|uniref:GMC family oxidoreductase N-terminal domain-containing protein n=1 Tax=Streptomyces levis TaxID=285566 RepID=A0ABN3NSS2_9ACTN